MIGANKSLIHLSNSGLPFNSFNLDSVYIHLEGNPGSYPPVGPALLAGVLFFLARGNVFRVDVALVTVACHEAVSSKVLKLCQNGLADGVGQLLLLGPAHACRLDGRSKSTG